MFADIFFLTQTGRWFLMCINGHHGNLLNCSWLKDVVRLNNDQLLPCQLFKVALHSDDEGDDDDANQDHDDNYYGDEGGGSVL